MTTITTEQLRDQTVIAELNDKLAKKKIKIVNIRNKGDPIFSLMASEYDTLIFQDTKFFLSVSNRNPYFHIMLWHNDFTEIQLNEVD